MTTATTTSAAAINRVSTFGVVMTRRRPLPFVVVLIGPNGKEQLIGRFAYASDAWAAAQAFASKPCPPGDWTYVAQVG